MTRGMRIRWNAWLWSCLVATTLATPVAAAQPEPPDGVTTLLEQVQQALASGQADAFLALVSPLADPARAQQFAAESFTSGVTRAVLRERDRSPLPGTLPGDGYRLMVEAFVETGPRARIVTWRLDVRRPRVVNTSTAGPDQWRVVGMDRLTTVEGLYRLALTATRQLAARNLVVRSEDFELRLPDGSVFVAEVESGVTAMVLLGAGEMVFRPAPATEKGQVRIFAGSDVLTARFDAVLVRINPHEFDLRVSPGSLQDRPVDARDLRRAQQVFGEEVGKSFALDLGDLSADIWSMLPAAADFLAEVRTRRFDTLTYARASNQPEDISLFDRAKRRNIALYTSAQRFAARGRWYDEDDLADYDVLDYDMDVRFAPDKSWIDGTVRLKVRVRSYAMATMTLKLADSLAVSSVASVELGRLLHFRVKYQDSFVVNFPSPLPRGAELTLTVAYAGALEPQDIVQESFQVRPGATGRADDAYIPPETNLLYSNRSHWYPQSPVSDYATATLRVTLPAYYGCVASGTLASTTPMAMSDTGRGAERLFIFNVAQPARYLAVQISRFVRVDAIQAPLGLAVPDEQRTDLDGTVVPAGLRNGPTRDTLPIVVDANPRQQRRGRDLAPVAADIVRFYTGLLWDTPYPSLTLALVEGDLPGGHSPAYLVTLNQPLPTTPFQWRNDPAAFRDFPEFYLAHEIAHQWWGQAVGWENYHEQWLSEGFAQYFAALYAERKHGRETFEQMLRQFRRWTIDASDQGPVYLGYRIGHIRNESRTFRALVYNKAAGVLHMLRRLVGDDLFFSSLRRFYFQDRFRKAGTDDLEEAFESETGRPWQRFFDRWIYGTALPRLRYTTTIGDAEVVVRFEQIGEVFDVPVTVTVLYADGRTQDVMVPIAARAIEQRIPVNGVVRTVEVNRDAAALAVFEGPEIR